MGRVLLFRQMWDLLGFRGIGSQGERCFQGHLVSDLLRKIPWLVDCSSVLGNSSLFRAYE